MTIAVAGVLLTSVGGIARGQSESQPGPAAGATPVTVVQVARRDVAEYARGIGTVQAYRAVLVRARVDGTLESVNFREGQDVHPGDLLAEIDPRPYAATLAQAQARRAADQAQLENARRDLVRYNNLVRTNVASRQQADTQQALVDQDVANIQGDEAAIASAALNLSFCRITAPIDGVVGLRLIDIGNLIHATDSTGIVSINQVHPISLVFTLPQDQLPAIRDAMRKDGGHPLVIATASDGTTPLSQGSLVTINNSVDSQTGTIELKAEFANTDNKLWPGQFASGLVRLAIVHDALTLPPSAVQHGPDGLYVYVVKPDNTVAKQAVSLGYQDEMASIVTDGLRGGETVVLSGQLRLQPGMHVAVQRQGAS
jgi:multidrug efflux system membrane fusion protein